MSSFSIRFSEKKINEQIVYVAKTKSKSLNVQLALNLWLFLSTHKSA